MNYLVLGERGMVGQALVRELGLKFRNDRLDLRHRGNVDQLLDEAGDVDVLFLVAARVGGIGANVASPGDFIYDNLLIQTNVIDSALRHEVGKIVFFGSSCIYPANSPRPIPEFWLGAGQLEPTNSSYAMAKLAGIEMLRAYSKQYGLKYLIPMPCNLYGPGDHFEDSTRSHMVPALIHKFHQARLVNSHSVALWGTGTPRRELMHVDDLVSTTLHLLDQDVEGVVNVGVGRDWQIWEIAQLIASTIDYSGDITWDGSKPDGADQKLLDISLLKSCNPPTSRPLTVGLQETYEAYLKNLCVA